MWQKTKYCDSRDNVGDNFGAADIGASIFPFTVADQGVFVGQPPIIEKIQGNDQDQRSSARNACFSMLWLPCWQESPHTGHHQFGYHFSWNPTDYQYRVWRKCMGLSQAGALVCHSDTNDVSLLGRPPNRRIIRGSGLERPRFDPDPDRGKGGRAFAGLPTLAYSRHP